MMISDPSKHQESMTVQVEMGNASVTAEEVGEPLQQRAKTLGWSQISFR
jgi:hypothetical protein